MTKEELEKEVTEYLNTQTLPKIDSLVYRVIKNLIFGFAEPREKRIAELEEISTRLESYYQNQKVRIEELEKENKVLAQNLEDSEIIIAGLKAQIEKMKCCGNCKYYQFQNDAGYCTCTKDGKRNGKNYRSCEFNLEKWKRR